MAVWFVVFESANVNITVAEGVSAKALLDVVFPEAGICFSVLREQDPNAVLFAVNHFAFVRATARFE